MSSDWSSCPLIGHHILLIHLTVLMSADIYTLKFYRASLIQIGLWKKSLSKDQSVLNERMRHISVLRLNKHSMHSDNIHLLGIVNRRSVSMNTFLKFRSKYIQGKCKHKQYPCVRLHLHLQSPTQHSLVWPEILTWT